MTTIVATRTALYSDSQCTSEVSFGTDKLYKVTSDAGEEYLVGIAGRLTEGLLLIRLLAKFGLEELWTLHLPKDGKDQIPEALKDEEWGTELVVVTRDKRIVLVDNALVPASVNEAIYAIGSGSPWAMAAVEHGKSAREAVEYACAKDPYSKAPIQTLTFRSK